MNGLEISRKYFEQCGLPMLRDQFPDLLPHLAAGLFGSGSECFGFDDEVSRDHDFEPGFLIFLPGEDVIDRKVAFALERAYARLPREFMGIKRSFMAPVGGSRHGVVRIEEFFQERTGSPDGILTVRQWLETPAHALSEVENGTMFVDNPGTVTELRRRLARYPEDIRRKKLAGHILLCAQSGQYNYSRCLQHGEEAAAQMAVFAFAQHAMSAIFLLNDVYEPFYKWGFRALRALPKLSIEAELLEFLITTNNEPEMANEKYDVIEGIAADLIDELIDQGLTKANCGDLEKHAYSVNDGIVDGNIRNLHILAGV